MANLFLPQLITWFRLDEHVKRLKNRVDALELIPSGVESVSGPYVNNLDTKNPIVQITNASASSNGVMSQSDFRKLNNLSVYLNNNAAGAAGVQNGMFYLKPDGAAGFQVMMYSNET